MLLALVQEIVALPELMNRYEDTAPKTNDSAALMTGVPYGSTIYPGVTIVANKI